eukprot:770567-Pelagomonas_calceolata.AAC.1
MHKEHARAPAPRAWRFVKVKGAIYYGHKARVLLINFHRMMQESCKVHPGVQDLLCVWLVCVDA